MSKLPLVELFIYFSVWIGTNCYMGYNLFQVQTELLEYFSEDKWLYLEPGWDFLSKYRDVSDIQWKSWKFFLQRLWYYLIFQFFVSEVIRFVNKSNSYLKCWYIISSVIFITSYMGLKQMIIIIIQPALFLVMMFSGCGKCSIWLISCVLIGAFNIYTSENNTWDIFKVTYDEEAYLLLMCIAWTEVRCISFCMEYIDRKEKLNTSKAVEANDLYIWKTIINMLCYIFYLPLLYTGSVIIYEDFERSFRVQSEDITRRLQRFIWDMALFLLYSLFLDLVYHYVYFRGMQFEIEALMDMPKLALCGGGLWMGYVFHVKHVISFGTTSAYARLDHMEAPPIPRCFARIHLYSQMWRYFDVGLYKFLVKYIYKPSLSVVSRDLNHLPETLQKLASSFPTFIFIFIWHGTTWDTLDWTAIHVLSFTLETLGKAASTTDAYKRFKKQVLRSDEMEVRFLALVCTPLLILSTSSTSYLMGVSNNVYSACLLHTSIWNNVLVALFMYSFCQVSIALQHVSARTDVKKTVVHRKTH